jgi:ABC-type multidrug transport system ATPase subunit
MGALLSCKDLSKKFSTRNGPKVVFNSLSMVLDKGEGLFVCGPNGTGKTTLLSILAGLVQLSGGRIDLGDEELTPFNHKIRNRVGFALRVLGTTARRFE